MTERHPEDLLGPFLDGDLGAQDRRAVDEHVRSCARCAEELELARRATVALSALEDVPAPAGLATPAIQRAKPEARWVRRLGLAAAGTAAAALIAIFAITRAADVGTLGADEAQAPGSEAVQEDGDTAAGPDTGPQYLESDTDFSTEEVRASLSQLASGRDGVAVFGDTSGEGLAQRRALEAIRCIEQAGLRGDAGTTLLQIVAARFEGTPAYIVLFTRGEDRFEAWVIHRETCGILHVANSS